MGYYVSPNSVRKVSKFLIAWPRIFGQISANYVINHIIIGYNHLYMILMIMYMSDDHNPLIGYVINRYIRYFTRTGSLKLAKVCQNV